MAGALISDGFRATGRVIASRRELEMGHTGLEPVTSCVSYKRASQLRQWPDRAVSVAGAGRVSTPGRRARIFRRVTADVPGLGGMRFTIDHVTGTEWTAAKTARRRKAR